MERLSNFTWRLTQAEPSGQFWGAHAARVLVAAASPQQSSFPFLLKFRDSRTSSESPGRRGGRSAIGYLYDLCPVWSFSGFVSIRNLWTKIVSAGTPLQRTQSDGQAFKPAPEPGALPKHACNPLVKFVGVILLFGFYSSNAWG